MAKVKAASSSKSSEKTRHALTPEARENQLIALAVNLAEQQLKEGIPVADVETLYSLLESYSS